MIFVVFHVFWNFLIVVYFDDMLASKAFFEAMFERDEHVHMSLYRAFYFYSTGDGVKRYTDKIKFETKLIAMKNNKEGPAANWRLKFFQAGKMAALGE